MGEDRQREIVAFLESGAAFGVAPEAVERIDTHAAIVFLAGERAFKMKRAVRYSFLDFSTLENRHRALSTELELNRENAPEIYLHLLPVTREADAALRLGGEGEVVEWLLEMRRFDQDAILDRVALGGGLDDGLIERLAGVVAHFHRTAERRPDHGGYHGLARVVDGNRGDLEALAGEVLDAGLVAEADRLSRARLEAGRAQLEARRLAGRVRFCHGDLHLANIVLLDGAPVLFDRIEFNESFACIDVLYDLAFLLMDLLHRDLGRHAQHLLDSYLYECEDDAGLALLPLFLGLRATIRAKVEGLAARLQEDESARAAHAREAGRYLELARAVLSPEPARLVAVGGLSGSGKSTLARRLAPSIGAPPGAIVLRSDVIRKRLFNVAPSERLPPEAYRPEVTERVYARMRERAAVLLAVGQSVIADAVFGDAGHRRAIEAVAERVGVPFAGLWLEATAELLERRVAARAADASDATVAVVRDQLRIDQRRIPWRHVDAGAGIDQVVDGARALLAGS